MEDRELQWEDTIEKDAPEFVLLPEGDYNFTVESFGQGTQGARNSPRATRPF